VVTAAPGILLNLHGLAIFAVITHHRQEESHHHG